MMTDFNDSKKDLESSNVMISVMGTNFDPWKNIFLSGQRETWLKGIAKKHKTIHVHCRYYGSVIQNMGKAIEFLRWNAGRRSSYLIAYALMIVLFPFRAIVPRLRVLKHREHESLPSIEHMRLNCLETLTSLRWKKLSVINYFLKSTYKYLLFVNPSTYVSVKNLERFLESTECIEKRFLYAGQCAHSADSRFVIGSFMLLNRNSAQLLWNGRWKIVTHTLDDVAFGKFFSDNEVEAMEMASINISSKQLPPPSELKDMTNIRIKIETKTRVLDEVDVMKALYRELELRY